MGCFNENQPSKECLVTILDTMAEGVVISDSTGNILYSNSAMTGMSGYSAGDLTSMRCSDFMQCPGIDNKGGDFSLKSVKDIECLLQRADTSTLPVLRNRRVMESEEDGKVLGVVETFTDISVLKHTRHKMALLEERIKNGNSHMGIIGRSHAIRRVFEMIDLAADSNATLLVTGETGTGKELVAKAVHKRGRRSDGPFVAVNCSALPESLLESELFGHVRGAFTGAVNDKPGRFEVANGGTLFLDEIGEVSPLIQVKLLKFLQDKEFERVGESVTRSSDLRIIAATNRDLRKMVRNGEFREDLYYRLKVFPIHLPPLRERKEDIGPLSDYFIKRFNKETGKSITGLSHDAAVTFMDYCWPGNIRELENAVEHGFVTCREGDIGLFDIPLEIRRVELREDMCTTDTNSDGTGASGSIKGMSKEELQGVLNRFKGNRTETAKYLGVDRTTLWRRMKKLGIDME
ncbi:MAG: sigma-54 interaction domain-containing protein [Chitinivibrionales bacterium]